MWGVQPSDFWRMHPSEFWWLVEAKAPQALEDKWASLYEMIK
jgi:hypothetical protein